MKNSKKYGLDYLREQKGYLLYLLIYVFLLFVWWLCDLLWQPMASVPSLMRFELPALFALAAATYPMMRSDGALSGREGGILLAAWLLFVAAELWLTFA